MKKLVLAAIVMAGLVSGCVVYDPPHRHGPDYRVDRDRDGDGVPNHSDRRPDNPRRY